VAAERPLSLDPLIGGDDPAVHDVGHLLYRSLLRLDKRAYPSPDLAKAFTVSADGLTYRLGLDAGQRWSNGHAITPDDVLATVAFAQSSRAVDRRVTAALQGVRVGQEGSTLMFTLPTPLASFPATLTQLPVLPLGGLSAAALDSLAAHASRPMPTSGAYRVSASGSASILLERNPYAPVRPHLAQYELRLFSSFADAASAFARGDIDALMSTTPAQRARLLGTHGAVAHDISTFRFVDVLFNQRVPGLDDAVVRQAIALAVNRAAILSGALQGAGGVAQADAVTEGLPWVAGTLQAPPASSDTPDALLAADGWTIGDDALRQKAGQELDFTLSVPNADPLPAVAREFANQMKSIGIGLRLQLMKPSTFVPSALVARSFQLALGDWDEGPDPDVSSFWRSNAEPPQGFNVSGAATDPFLDRALDSLATLADPQARIMSAGDVSRFLAADVPAVFLYTPAEAFVTRVRLKGQRFLVDGGSAARYDTVASWRRS